MGITRHRKNLSGAPAALQTVVLNFSLASAKLELGLEPDFSSQELLARERANSNPVISPARRHLSKVRACTLTGETAVIVGACCRPLIYRSLCRGSHGFLMQIMPFTVSLPGAGGKRRIYAGRLTSPWYPVWAGPRALPKLFLACHAAE